MKDDFKQSIVISLLKAIKSMYNNKIIHGDLKTPNLAINIKDEDKYIKIIDYGTCYYNMDNIYIEDVIGTDGYYAPEQDNNILNHKSDIYSVGIMIIEIYVGNIWHSGDTFSECRNEVLKSLRMIKKENIKLEKLLRKCIDLDHKKRPDIYKLYDMFISI